MKGYAIAQNWQIWLNAMFINNYDSVTDNGKLYCVDIPGRVHSYNFATLKWKIEAYAKYIFIKNLKSLYILAFIV